MIDDSKIRGMVDDVFKANDYAYNYSEVSESDWDTPLWDEEQMKDAIEKGIRCGIQEFVKSLWHDATEEPDVKLDAWLIMQTGKDLYETVKYGGYNEDGGQAWQQQAKKGNILRWCYLSDLLPKEGGKK